MRLTAKVSKSRNEPIVQPVPLPAPTGGWDSISPLANMPADRAVQLDNFVCKPGWVQPRNGYQIWSAVGQNTGQPQGGPIDTIMAYNNVGGTRTLFAAFANGIYDITTKGNAILSLALASSRLQYKMFTNFADNQQWLVVVNGIDTPLAFNGTSWKNLFITGLPSTGLNSPSSFINVNSHQSRLWFVPKNSTDAVYLTNVDAVEGGAAIFPLGAKMTKGGYLLAIGTWTVDTRQTVDEYIAFITSRGQVIVYQGTDPSSALTWNLVGVYDLGTPIGPRCFCRITGDLQIITVDGVVGMSEMLSTDRAAANRVSLTSIILNAMNLAAQTYRNNFGWQIIEYALGTLIIVNIPVIAQAQQQQFVMNTITGAWSKWTGINANCWEVDALDNIYFGGNDGNVYQFDVGSSDNGTPITAICKTAYNPFGNAGRLKRYTMLQPLITTTGTPIPSIGVNVDFVDRPSLSTAQPIGDSQAKWGQVKWGAFKWGASTFQTNNWLSVDGIGHYVSIVTQIVSTANPGNPTEKLNLQLNGWNITAETGAFV